jgi:putative SOS response-associated peptidase YedK
MAAADLFGTDQDPLPAGAGAGPGRPGQVIRLHPQTGKRHIDWLTWGLRPGSVEQADTTPRPIHARAETVVTHPMFADAFRRRRALVPASEYYQRATKGELRLRYAVARWDGQPMAIAGLWEVYVTPERQIVRTYCIITTEANAIVAPIHDRMPLVLDEKDWPLWLGEADGDPAILLCLPADDLLALRLLPIR